jgi:hypothetical protein
MKETSIFDVFYLAKVTRSKNLVIYACLKINFT